MSSVSVVERLLKTAISSQNSEIASSAMICTLFMVFKGFNVAKSWVSEISEKLTASIGQESLLTFHTLLLLKQIKTNDKLFLIKIYSKLGESYSYKSQFAKCQLIRYVSEMLRKEDLTKDVTAHFNAFLEKSMYSIEDSIKIEACRAVLNANKTKESLQKAAIGVLCEFLNSNNNITLFAVLKTLNANISRFSSTIAIDIFLEIEKIIENNDINSSIKALALAIFLKISKGLSDYRLEKMFKTFIEQYPTFKDEFKRDVVIISKEISRENTQKSKLYYTFFCELFKLNANAATKLEIFDALVWFIYNSNELKLQTLLFLAEFIADCQYEVVKVRILNLLGKECQLCAQPGKLIRHVVNQINLETPMVRASAISALAEIACKDKSQRKTVMKYVMRCFNDSDSEVRERAFFYYKALKEVDEDVKSGVARYLFNNNTVKGGNGNVDVDVLQSVLKAEKESLLKAKDISSELSSMLNNPEYVSNILLKNKTHTKQSDHIVNNTTQMNNAQHKMNSSSLDETNSDDGYKRTMFNKVYGSPKITTNYTRLTDQTAEYLTSYRKIIHDKVVVLDFEISNTIELQVINKVSIDIDELESTGFDFTKTEIIDIDSLSTNQKGHLYLKLLKDDNSIYSTCSFKATLKFDLQELDVKGNAHGIAVKEQYKIDKVVDVSYADYFAKNQKVNLMNFGDVWKVAENSGCLRKEEKISLPYNSIRNAGKAISEIIGLTPVNDVDKVDSNAKRFEFVYAYVSYLDNLLFVKLQVVMSDSNKCLAKVVVLSQDETVMEMVFNKIYS